jgi:hypothetical protein
MSLHEQATSKEVDMTRRQAVSGLLIDLITSTQALLDIEQVWTLIMD